MPLADRRLASRYEIVGQPWGTLETFEPLRVHNLSREGMLVESAAPLAVGSVHEFQLINGTVTARIRAAVRHVSSAGQEGSGSGYLIGLEILNLTYRPRREAGESVRADSAVGAKGGQRWTTSSQHVVVHRVSPRPAAPWSPGPFPYESGCWI